MARKSEPKGQAPGKSRGREVVGILLLILSIILFLSLVTHNEDDWPGSSRAFGEPTNNLIGNFGAFVSHVMFQYIGFTGYFLVAFMIVAGVFIFLHRNLIQLVKPFIFITVLGVSLPLLASLVFQLGDDTTIPDASTSFGGMLGIMAAYAMTTYLGRAGAILVTLAVVLVDLVLSTNLKPSTMVEYGIAGAKGVAGWFMGALKSRTEEKKSTGSKRSGKGADGMNGKAPLPGMDDAVDDDTPFLTPVEDESPVAQRPPFTEPTIQFGASAAFGAKQVPEEAYDEDDYEFDEEDADGAGEDADGEIEDADGEEEEALDVSEYRMPGPEILDDIPSDQPSESREELLDKARHLVESLRHFNIEAEVKQITPGPIVTRYELTLAPGVKVGRVVNLSDDLQLALKARGGIRILAPIPGKAAIGIEVPNKLRSLVYFREIVESEPFQEAQLPLVLALGKNTAGEPVVADLAKMPHLLIAGSTGSGKSVCINTLIASILMKATPDQVRMIMIDPKVVELSIYNSIPHLLSPVVSDPKHASNVLKWAVSEMESRYRLLASQGVRDILQYNAKVARLAEEGAERDTGKSVPDPLPFIVVIIDEFADLMVVASNEVEEYIARLAQMARAVGIHLILATQRPSSDVITGLIKANFPSRIAFKVMQASNSRIILDTNGADKLLGMGDMLFLQVGKPEPIRLHGAYISNEECLKLTDFVTNQSVHGLDKIPEEVFEDYDESGDDNSLGLRDPDAKDALFFKAARLVVRNNQGSVSLLQRRLKIGYARAARLIDQLELAGIVSPYDGSKAREVLVDDLFIDDLEAGDI